MAVCKSILFAFCLLFVAFAAADEPVTSPQQVRVAFAGFASDGTVGMTISWLTYDPIQAPVAKIGAKSGEHSIEVAGETTFYYKSHHHNAVVRELKHSTTYFYVCGDNQTNQWSNEFNFTTPPLTGTEKPFKVAVYGDMGITNSEQTRERLMENIDNFDFVFHIGDFAYADDRVAADYETVWNIWQQEMEPITSRKAYMVCPGNHEATCSEVVSPICPKELKNFTAYNHRFRMPSEESGGALNMFYSFDYGNVHFVSISTETDYPGAPEGPWSYWWSGPFGNQLEWLEADLKKANANRDKTKWIVVGGHRPMYSAGKSDIPPWAKAGLKGAMEKLFKKYNVDIFFAGHVHSYQRMFPVYQDKLEQTGYNNPESPVHVVIGCAGNIEGHTAGYVSPLPNYLAKVNDVDYGYGILNVLNSTTVHWTFHRAIDNTVADEFFLTKHH